MSEVRFDRIDHKFAEVDQRFDRVDAWQRNADDRFERIDAWQRNADDRFERIDDWQRNADQRFDRIEARLEHLHERVGILHEDVLSRFAAIPDPTPRLEAKIDRAVAELTEAIGRRLDPLEIAVRQHSKEIDRLKRRRG